MNKKPAIWRYGFILLLALLRTASFAQGLATPVSQTSVEPFTLKNGDRVVFLGNSLMENDLLYGYLELALTTRWPDRTVTFRNIGWSGDTVFGDARSYFTNPPTPYELLMKQITEAQPTVVFVAYGGIEAQEGEAGLARFNEGLNKLLDKIQELGAKTVLLSPIPSLSTHGSENTTRRNAELERYASALATTAAERGTYFVDIFKPIHELQKKFSLTDNDIHLNETGYFHLAMALENGLGLPPRQEVATIDLSKQNAASSATFKILKTDPKNAELTFTVEERYLPLPLPTEKGASVNSERVLRITGLKKGYYTLAADDEQIVTASAKEWADGVPIRQGPSFAQASQLRTMIVKKNELFFHQYRPHNRTYILGFRSYEQGRHAEGLKELGLIVTWLEGQISLHRMPLPHTYRLSRLR
ncbi:GDSL family lipase [Cytophagaceae bacterium SJW1-29]|uniref:GDSL family lipase n=2 Tax=Salmonirosea aquatica TaxID=2654236 RepID=A0A7C9BGF2_9BACT|nr:GDSL family lipase [Cytophagaceae bacterium SJW1-29]